MPQTQDTRHGTGARPHDAGLEVLGDQSTELNLILRT
jgi:hypothetical protein